MMNEKHNLKMPGVDRPIFSVEDLGAYEVAHSFSFAKIGTLPSSTRNPSLHAILAAKKMFLRILSGHDFVGYIRYSGADFCLL